MSIKFLNKIVTVSALMSSAGAMEEHATLDQLPVEIKQKNQDFRGWEEICSLFEDCAEYHFEKKFGVSVEGAIEGFNNLSSVWTKKYSGLSKELQLIEVQPISTRKEAYCRMSLIKKLVKSLPEEFVEGHGIKIESAYLFAAQFIDSFSKANSGLHFPINLWDYSSLLEEKEWSFCVPSPEYGQNGVPKYIRYVNKDRMPRQLMPSSPKPQGKELIERDFNNIKTLDQRDSSYFRVYYRHENAFLETRKEYLTFFKIATFKEKYEVLLRKTIARNNRKQPPLRQAAVRGNVSRLVDAFY